jgi:hypothetical protein
VFALGSKRKPGNSWIAIALAAATAVAYLPVLSNGFVNYDDDRFSAEYARVLEPAGRPQEAARLAFAQGSSGVHTSLARRAKAYRAAMEP